MLIPRRGSSRFQGNILSESKRLEDFGEPNLLLSENHNEQLLRHPKEYHLDQSARDKDKRKEQTNTSTKMPAPTALQRAPEALAIEESIHDPPQSAIDQDVLIHTSTQPELFQESANQEPEASDSMQVDSENRPVFAPEVASPTAARKEERKVRIPPHRMTPLKTAWPKIYPPLVEHLGLQLRMNVAKKAVELRTSSQTLDTGALQKGTDFITAFTLGFDVDDAIALLRLDDLYIETFEAVSYTHLTLPTKRIV